MAAGGIAAVSLSSTGPTIHRDGAGPLGSVLDPTTRSVVAFDRNTAGPWTLGFALCLAQGTSPATITSVDGTERVGAGYRVPGILIRSFVPTTNDPPIISVDGFPPTLPESAVPAVGAVISTQCSRGVIGQPYTELLLGFSGMGSDGGGWRGISVHYTVSGHDYVAQLGYDVLMCGPAIEPEAECHPPPSSPSPSP